MNDTRQRPEKDASTGLATTHSRAGRLFGFAVLVVLLVALSYGAWRNDAQNRQVMETAQKSRDLVPSLRVAKVKASDPIIDVTLPATTLAFTMANIYARVSGYISKRNVDIGDRVKTGDLLVEISAPEIDHQLAQAEATLAQNKAAVAQILANKELARVTAEREDPLVRKGYESKLQGDTNRLNLQAQEAQVAVAKANVAAQEAQVKVARQQKKYLSVLAPFDGVVTKRNVNIGDLVQGDATSGTFMFTVMESEVIRTQVYVPQDQAFGLAPGVKAVVRVPELPGRTFPGTVTRVADALQPGTRTLLAEIDIENPDEVLTPGLYCTVELYIPRKNPSLLVPASAIIFDQNGMQVAVVKDSTAHIQTITVARDLGTDIEVRDGVKEGDEVILNPPVTLANGDKVNIRPAEKSAATK
jgi:RND family efflux transporter MFP subunit